MASTDEFMSFWKRVRVHFPAKDNETANENARMVEFAAALTKHSGKTLGLAVDRLVAEQKWRELPTVGVFNEYIGRVEDATGDKRTGWNDLQQRFNDRWREADQILECHRSSDNDQIAIANAEGFWPEFAAIARRVIWERLRDRLKPDELPFLPARYFNEIRRKNTARLEADAWRKTEEGQKILEGKRR